MAPLTAMLAELGDQNGSNMVKISDPKINRFFNGSSNRFVIDFSRFWYPKSMQILKTSISRGIKNMIYFWIAYFDHVGFVLVPKFRQLGRQWRHLGPQEPPTWLPRGPQELGTRSNFSSFFRIWPPRRPETDFEPNLH